LQSLQSVGHDGVVGDIGLLVRSGSGLRHSCAAAVEGSLVEMGVAVGVDSLLCFPLLWSADPQIIVVGSISLGCC
jgi:hypothetical protein